MPIQIQCVSSPKKVCMVLGKVRTTTGPTSQPKVSSSEVETNLNIVLFVFQNISHTET